MKKRMMAVSVVVMAMLTASASWAGPVTSLWANGITTTEYGFTGPGVSAGSNGGFNVGVGGPWGSPNLNLTGSIVSSSYGHGTTDVFGGTQGGGNVLSAPGVSNVSVGGSTISTVTSNGGVSSTVTSNFNGGGFASSNGWWEHSTLR